MRKNVASQIIGAQMITISDGSAFTGTVRVAITIDGGTQDTTPGGTVTHEGRGFHSYTPTQAETNGNHIAFTFDDSGGLAVPVTVQVYTISYDPHDTASLGLTAVDSNVVQVAGQTAAATNLEILMDGNEGFYTAYMGPNGPGIYVNDASGVTGTTIGLHGTVGNPVDNIADAKSMADSMAIDRIYLVNDTEITLAATMTDYEFVGIGGTTGNVINLGSQDVSSSVFRSLTVEGTQGGAGRIAIYDGAIKDPGVGDTTLHVWAVRTGFVDRFQVDTSNDNLFEDCFSLVAGSTAPIIQATGAAGTINIRHYSGGLEFESLSASHQVSVEGFGNLIFGATNNVNATVVIRGNFSISDNTAGITPTETANINIANVADGVWDEATSGHSTAGTTGKAVTDILADTNELQSDDVPGLIAALNDIAATDVWAAATRTLSANTNLNDVSTADLATALTDIHLDHLLAVDYDPASKPGTATALLNELVESDLGVSRFTTNALENGPSGSGGDATEAKQDTIITHLTDVKGTGFAKDTHSLTDITADVTGLNGDAMRGTDNAALASALSTTDSKVDTINTNTAATKTAVGTAGDGLTAIPTQDANIVEVEGSANRAAKLAEGLDNTLHGEVVADGGNSTTQFKINLLDGDNEDATNDTYNGRTLTFTNGQNIHQQGKITDYTGATAIVEFAASTFTTPPDAGDDFVIT